MADIETRRNADGKVTSYRVRWRAKVDGEWKRKTRSFDPTVAGKAAAKRFAAELELNGGRAPAEAAEPGELTVRSLVDRYLEDRAKSRRIRSDRTVADYGRDARLHIYPALGDRSADGLTSEAVQEWHDALQKHNRKGEPTGEPASAKTAQNVIGVLSSAYKWGVRLRLVTANPCEGVEVAERPAPVVRGLRIGEWRLLHQAAKDANPGDTLAPDLLLFLVGTGWRWSEAAALQVLELELDRDPPTVQVGRVFRRMADNTVQLVEGSAKSRAGLRRVKIPEVVAEMLRARTHAMEPGEFVFQTAGGKPLRYGNFRERVWKPTLALAAKRGLRATPTIHHLRHAQVAMLLEVEPNLAAVQKRIGHADIATTTRVYGGLVDDISEATLSHLNTLLAGPAERPQLRSIDGGA